MALIHGKQLRPNTLKEELLLVTGTTATDGQILAYDAGSGGFAWVDNTGGVESVSGRTALDETTTTGNVVLDVRTDDASIYVDGSNNLTLGDPSNNNLISGGDYRFAGNLTVNGDFTVLGTATTVNTENLYVEDNLITLNSTFTAGTPSVNAGIEVLRGDETTVELRWNETNNWWEIGNPEGTGSTYNAILTTASIESTDSAFVVTQGTGGNADKLFMSIDESNLSGIPNSALTNSDITINVANGLTGGGLVSLGGSVTISGQTLPDFVYEFGGGTYSIQPINGTNNATGNYSTIGGGSGHNANGVNSVIAGGINNTVAITGGIGGNQGRRAFIGAGNDNTASGDRSVIVAGSSNVASNQLSTVVAGRQNTVSASHGFIGNGNLNTASTGSYATVINGRLNQASGNRSFIGNGQNNSASGAYSNILGGKNNTASSPYTSIIGGESNTANQNNSHLIGSNLTSVSANTTHVERLYIGTIDSDNSIDNVLVRDSNGIIRQRTVSSLTTDNYTTGATLIGSTVYFDRTDSLSAYTLDLSSLDTNDTFVTGGTLSGSNIVLERNDGQTVSIDISGSDFNDTFSTGITTNAGQIVITGNDGFTSFTGGTVVETVSGSSPITASTSNGSVTVGLDYSSLQLAVPTTSDKELTVTGTTSGNNSDTGISISSTPVNDGYVGVSVNGVWYIVGDGVTTKDCYFSSNGTSGGVRNIADITSGDKLVWNGTIVGFELDTSDNVAFHYNVLQ